LQKVIKALPPPAVINMKLHLSSILCK
jgi:hypothetical protein